jgi:hypothetical protein
VASFRSEALVPANGGAIAASVLGVRTHPDRRTLRVRTPAGDLDAAAPDDSDPMPGDVLAMAWRTDRVRIYPAP